MEGLGTLRRACRTSLKACAVPLPAPAAVIQPRKDLLPPMLEEAERSGLYDMDVMQAMFRNSCLTLPSEYDVLSGAFRSEDHAKYADGDLRPWDSKRMLQVGGPPGGVGRGRVGTGRCCPRCAVLASNALD